jgi:hypothetical protein
LVVIPTTPRTSCEFKLIPPTGVSRDLFLFLFRFFFPCLNIGLSTLSYCLGATCLPYTPFFIFVIHTKKISRCSGGKRFLPFFFFYSPQLASSFFFPEQCSIWC